MKHYNLHYYVSNSPLYGSPHGIEVAVFTVDAAMMLGIQATNCIAISIKFDNVSWTMLTEKSATKTSVLESVVYIKSFCFV